MEKQKTTRPILYFVPYSSKPGSINSIEQVKTIPKLNVSVWYSKG